MKRLLNFARLARGFTLNNRLKNVGSFRKAEFPKYPPAEFEHLGLLKLQKYQSAFDGLREADPAVEYAVISGFNNALSVGVKNVGVYKIWMDVPQSVMYLFSPQSGTYSYYYNKDQDQWTNTMDGHFMEELVTREFLKTCRGYLDL